MGGAELCGGLEGGLLLHGAGVGGALVQLRVLLLLPYFFHLRKRGGTLNNLGLVLATLILQLSRKTIYI